MNEENTNKSKCGIVTFHSSHNYGSVLQSYAMVAVMKKMMKTTLGGGDVELIDFRHPHTTDAYEWRFWTPYKKWSTNLALLILSGIMGMGKKREQVFREFIDHKLTKSVRIKSKEDIPASKYDILVCGSDQIWNHVATGENDPIYFLDFGTTRCKFSYAASAGSFKFPKQEHDKYARLLGNLQSIGVRERFLQDYLKEEFNLDSVVNPDPTLLVKTEEWAEMEIEYPNLPKRYLLEYSLQKTDATLAFARQVGARMGLPVVQICNSRTQIFNMNFMSRKNSDYNIMDASPQQFLWLFHHASFIVTNTFHGNMFSVIFRKPFVHYDVNGNDSRITTLHEAIGLERSRMIKSVDSLKEKDIHYDLIEGKIEAYANTGFQYINDCLSSCL